MTSEPPLYGGPASTYFGHPAAPHYPSAPPQSNGLSTAGFVCALIGLVLAFIPVVGVIAWPLIIVGLALSAVGMARASERGRGGLAVAGLVLAIVALVVCTFNTILTVQTAPTSSSTSSNTTTSTTSATGAGSDSYSGRTGADQSYLAILDQNGIRYSTEDNAIRAARATCTYFDENATLAQAATGFMSNGYTAYQSGVIVGAAVSSYCPKYTEMVRRGI